MHRPNVGRREEQTSARFENAVAFSNGLLRVRRENVLDDAEAEDEIDRFVGEGHRAHIAGNELYASGIEEGRERRTRANALERRARQIETDRGSVGVHERVVQPLAETATGFEQRGTRVFREQTFHMRPEDERVRRRVVRDRIAMLALHVVALPNAFPRLFQSSVGVHHDGPLSARIRVSRRD